MRPRIPIVVAFATLTFGCRTLASPQDSFSRETTVITGQRGLVVQATQQAMKELQLTIERESQMNDGTWMIVAHSNVQASEAGSILVEVKETGSDDITVSVRRRLGSSDFLKSAALFAVIRKILST